MRRRMRRVALGAAASATVLTTVLAGCGSSGSSSATTNVTLKLYNDKGAWSPFFTQLGAVSKKDIGIGLTPVGYTDEPTYQAFIQASFHTDKKPDLFTWQTGGQLAEIARLHQVASTSAIWQQGIADGDLPKGLEQYYTVDGQQYCVPLNVAYWGMFYNKHVFATYGLTPPASWAQLMHIAQVLKSHGVTPFYETDVLFSFVWFEQLLAGTAPDVYQELSTGKASYTSPAVVNVMKMWQGMINAGYMSDPADKTDPSVLLKDGQVAMVPDGSWFNTSMTQQNLKPGVDYGFFIIPNVNPALPKTSEILESGPLCSLANAPDPAASMKYLKWWITPAAQQPWSQSRGDASANPKVAIRGDADLSTVMKNAGEGKYNLLLRYFEAAPPPVLAAALDAFGAFMVHPNTYMTQLQTIQAAAQSYWSSHQAGS
jgi:multiple sugar transport system substrate-binding protein